MPVMERGGVRIHYEVFGDGYPLVLFAPGGMQSVARMWRERPDAPGVPLPWIDPTSELSGDFGVIAMDQRNAGASSAPITADDGWETYTADHLALLDHLGLDRVHVMGGCIGSSYCLALCRAVPGRVSAAVIQNPIGLSRDNRADFIGMFDGWASELQARRPDVTSDALAGFRQRMFGGDFVFSVGRQFVRECPVPMLVLAGNDAFHPRSVAQEVADLAPSAELVLEWAGPEHHDATLARVRQFLVARTPSVEPATDT
jgi:pimeloyl-ACP methyl ester carboxylesterase